MKYIGLVIFYLTLMGCAVLSEKGAQVALINTIHPALESCVYIGRIDESYRSSEIKAATKKARIRLKNLAAQKRANLVLITSSARNYFPTGWNVVGDAYSCGFTDLREVLIHSQNNIF